VPRPRSQQEIAEHTDVIRRNIDKADRTIASLIDLGRPRASGPVTMLASDMLAEVLQLRADRSQRRRDCASRSRSPGRAPCNSTDRTCLPRRC
jgi:hypothetical protein